MAGAPRPRLVSLPSLDELYAVEPDAFVAARNALAKQLKAAGDKETAAEVTRLRRPPVSAWALNQVARRQPDDISRLLDAAADLAATLADPASGDLRAAQRAFRAAIEHTVRAALDVVTSTGRTASPGLQQAAQATLQAAAVDEGIALALRAGVLAEDEPAPGFLFVDDAGASDESSDAAARGSRAAATTPARPAPKVIGGRRRDGASARTKGSATDPATRAAAKAAAAAEAAETARRRDEEREAERRRRARLAELRADAKRLERRAERLAATAEQAEAAALTARAEADTARDEADAVLAALEVAEADDA